MITTSTILNVAVASLLVLILIQKFLRYKKPHGLLHIDEYVDKDFYRMLYFVPIEDLKKCKYVILKVETKSWGTNSDDYEEDF